jgi:hypothetical protein
MCTWYHSNLHTILEASHLGKIILVLICFRNDIQTHIYSSTNTWRCFHYVIPTKYTCNVDPVDYLTKLTTNFDIGQVSSLIPVLMLCIDTMRSPIHTRPTLVPTFRIPILRSNPCQSVEGHITTMFRSHDPWESDHATNSIILWMWMSFVGLFLR